MQLLSRYALSDPTLEGADVTYSSAGPGQKLPARASPTLRGGSLRSAAPRRAVYGKRSSRRSHTEFLGGRLGAGGRAGARKNPTEAKLGRGQIERGVAWAAKFN